MKFKVWILIIIILVFCKVSFSQFTGIVSYDNAYRHFTAGEFEKAIKYYNEYLKSYPRDAKAYNERGLCHESLRQYKNAEEDYSTAITLKPGFDVYYNNRGYAYLKMGLTEKAYSDFSQSILLNPSSTNGYEGRVHSLIDLEKFPAALTDINHAISLDNNNPLFYNLRAVIYGLLEDTVRMFEDIERILDYYPEDFLRNYKSQFVVLAIDNLAVSVDEYTKMMKENPDDYFLYFVRGFSYLQLKRFTASINDFEKFISMCHPWQERYISFAKRFIDIAKEYTEK